MSIELPPCRVVNVSSSAGKVANMKDSPIKEKLISSGSTLTVRGSLNQWNSQKEITIQGDPSAR